nr:reverse transcriptase domain-containing protein [Tanacetum cinerariifolium]
MSRTLFQSQVSPKVFLPDTMCDVHLVNNPTPFEAKDHFVIVINSNDDYSSSDDDYLYNENIEYVEASPHDSKVVILEVAEIVILKVEEIEDDNLLEDDHSPLLAYVVWIFLAYLMYPIIPPYLHSFGNEDTIFDPGIATNAFSFNPDLSHRLLHLADSQPMLKSSYKAEDGVIISISPLVEGVANVVVEIKGTESVARQRITQSFFPNSEISFPPLREDEGKEGPMIIEAEIGGHCLHRMYVDGGSASEIPYEHCFSRLRLEIRNQLVPATTPLIGFNGEIIWPIGKIQLLVKIRDEEHSTSAWMNIVVVMSPSPHNGIIGRPRVRKLQAVSSIAHGMLKLSVKGGVITLKSSRMIPLECMMVSGLKGNLPITKKIVEERIKMKKRGQSADRNQAIQEEVGKLIEAGIMKEVYYHDWLFNPVMVKKHDDSWRICVDFRDLNKACPKDEYLLLEIDWKKRIMLKMPKISQKPGNINTRMEVSSSRDETQIILFKDNKRIFLAKNEFLEKVSSSVQKEYNDLLASNDVLKQKLETKFNLLQHDKSLEKTIEIIKKEMGDTVKCFDAEKKVFENEISKLEKVLEQRVKDFEELDSQNYTSLQKENNDLRTSYNELKKKYDTDEIISDNGKQFRDNPFKDWCEKLCIRQYFASVKHPQTNGLVERENQSLGEGIKARLDARSKNWMEELPHVLWAHRIMIKSNNRDTLFSLTYKTEVVIPKKKREQAAIREAKSKVKMKKYYKSKVRSGSFKPGDLVYRNNDASRVEDTRKIGPKWEGPYEVTKALGKCAYKLRDRDEKQLPRTWNVSNLKM